MWVKVQGIRSINGRHTIGGDVKNSMGNGETKELIRMTHGHELSGGIAGGKEGTTQWVQRGENWDNCNSIINKIYFLKTVYLTDIRIYIL